MAAGTQKGGHAHGVSSFLEHPNTIDAGHLAFFLAVLMDAIKSFLTSMH